MTVEDFDARLDGRQHGNEISNMNRPFKEPEISFSESDTTTMKFKPVCERCGYTLPLLSLRGNTSSRYMREWHFEPISCPRCGRRIVTAELPRIKAEEINYTE